MIKALVHSALFPLLIALAGASYAQIPQIERDALVALYNSTDGANWTDNTGWLGEAGTECSWFGVRCYADSGKSVSNLFFWQNGLNGTIPSELGNLSNLTNLHLGSNSLTGTIPSELGNLTKLAQILLFSNSLTGGIPSELGNLANLTYLQLSNNSLSGSIPSELGNLSNLTFLHLGRNSLTGTIPSELGNLTNLTSLSLENNILSGSIPSELGNLTNLIDLLLSYNYLSGSIPSELSNLTNLVNLSFYTSQIGYTAPIPSSVKKLSNSLGLLKTSLSRTMLLEIDSDSDGISDIYDDYPMYKAEYKIISTPEASIIFSKDNRVVNLISEKFFKELTIIEDNQQFAIPLDSMGQFIYEHFDDQFDFLMFTPNSLGDGTNFAVRMAGENTGLGKSHPGASPQLWGSNERLKSAIYYSNPFQIKTGPGLHEIAHTWGTPDMFLFEGIPGHSGNSNLGGILGGWKPNTLENLGNGRYTLEASASNDIGPKGWAGNFLPYGNFELYLMGLLSKEEVGHDLIQANDLERIDYSGIYSASSITTTTMDEFIEKNGPRIPSTANSQKHFESLFIVVSEAPLTLDEWNLYNNNLAEFEAMKDDGFNDNYNFWEATQEKASIAFSQADHVLTSSERYELSNTAKNIIGISTAGVLASIIGGWRSTPDTDNLAGESISFTAIAASKDGSTPSTLEWLVGNSIVATGLSAEIFLPDGKTPVIFRATDAFGNTSSSRVVITVSVPAIIYAQAQQVQRDALVALYNSTDGANWTDNTDWLGAAGTECSWFGVTCTNGSVSRLSFWKNGLNGTIPSELGNLSNLTYLHLKNNSLTGTIPSELGNLTNLTSLSLENNILSGSIPSELGNLSNLTFLHLGRNSLTGTIPSELGNLTKLTQIFLFSNSLTGTIPSELGNLTNLTYLQLSNNSLSGSIPSELGNLTKLTTFNYTGNAITGNISPLVTISDSSRTISDIDEVAGESVSFTATATDSDGTIATTQWLIDGAEVATGLSATLSLPNGPTVVTFKATDDDGASSITTATITVASPAYEPTAEWSSPYNGVTPDTSLGLAFNNIGVVDVGDGTIYTCLRVFTNGAPAPINGISQFDVGLKIVSSTDATVQITKSRAFNAISALNEDGQLPDCSGVFETTTGLYTDIIQSGTTVLDTKWNLIDPKQLILKLQSAQELRAN